MSEASQLSFDEFLPEDQQEALEDKRSSIHAEDVVLYSTDWTVETAVAQIKKKRINLNPSFQRRQAWDVAHRSYFIESLILGIPVPQIVLAEHPKTKGNFIVIDGKQRLLSIAQFLESKESDDDGYNKFSLRLPLRKELNGLSYEELTDQERAQIDNTVVRTVIIRAVKNQDFLYEAFLRLNQGSKPLSPQELRQALVPGEFTDWLDKYVCSSEPIKKALKLKEPDSRMRDTEVALRFMAYNEALNGYNGSFKNFLDNYMKEKNKTWSQKDADELSDKLARAINTTFEIFGEDAFRKFDSKSVNFTNKFNRAVFDSMTFFFAREEAATEALKHATEIKNAFISLCNDSRDYVSAVESSFKEVSSTYTRLALWREKLSEILPNVYLPIISIENDKIKVV